jgi:hypothetical protein
MNKFEVERVKDAVIVSEPGKGFKMSVEMREERTSDEDANYYQVTFGKSQTPYVCTMLTPAELSREAVALFMEAITFYGWSVIGAGEPNFMLPGHSEDIDLTEDNVSPEAWEALGGNKLTKQ